MIATEGHTTPVLGCFYVSYSVFKFERGIDICSEETFTCDYLPNQKVTSPITWEQNDCWGGGGKGQCVSLLTRTHRIRQLMPNLQIIVNSRKKHVICYVATSCVE